MHYRWPQGGNRRRQDCDERASCLRRLDAEQVRRPQSWAQDRRLTEGREYVLAVGHGELKIVVTCR
jgi:hypothetical protein